jgi:hypothetical protein
VGSWEAAWLKRLPVRDTTRQEQYEHAWSRPWEHRSFVFHLGSHRVTELHTASPGINGTLIDDEGNKVCFTDI